MVSFGMFWIFKKNIWKEGTWNSQWVTLLMSRRHARESLRMTCRLAVCSKKCRHKKRSRPASMPPVSKLINFGLQQYHPRNTLQFTPEILTLAFSCISSWPWPSAVKPTLTCPWAGIGICFQYSFRPLVTADLWLVPFFLIRQLLQICWLVSIFLWCLWPFDLNSSIVSASTWSIAIDLVDRHSNHKHNMDISWTMFLRPGEL